LHAYVKRWGTPPSIPALSRPLPRRGYRFLGTVTEAAGHLEDASNKRARLVVLPFVNLSGDPEQEYFSDAMMDEIITAMANLAPEHVAVIARTTAMHYKRSHKDVARIAHELGVDYVVEGGVRRTDGRVGINVQLIQASDQAHLFAQRYDAELCEVFALQGSIAQAIADHIPSAAGKMRTGGGRPRRQETDGRRRGL